MTANASPGTRQGRKRPARCADAVAFARRFDGRKRKPDAAEMTARIVAAFTCNS